MEKNKPAYHNPALLRETLEGLNIQAGGKYVDATFGGGGHSRGILEKLGKKGRLYAFDRDADAQINMIADERLTLIHHEFIHLKNFLRYFDALPADGILADLGISSHHVDDAGRGFSFRFDAPLDMRMDKQSRVSAKDIVNEAPQERLQDIFSKYGEVQNARTLSQAIVRKRKIQAIETTTDLAQIAQDVLPRKENLKKYLAPVFQALRIEVNDELGGLKTFLLQATDVLKPGGRLAVITYHSLEDRIVKNFIAAGNFEGKTAQDIFGNAETPLKAVTRKPITPGEEEINTNPRSRSAKLRLAEKNQSHA
ncbi:MAG: 16S rRNA (cytosine(1402)-N(4))-methyltransferase RsmH [Bacteroidota bacterium]|nr:16S rRNA (cytosine(1402)-N(4))-methyltransferase RsmH [Bacteroidota bacterium]